MVKVISKKPVSSKKCICSNCGYKLEYTIEDVKRHDYTDYAGYSDTYYYIICPRTNCNNKNEVKQYIV